MTFIKTNLRLDMDGKMNDYIMTPNDLVPDHEHIFLMPNMDYRPCVGNLSIPGSCKVCEIGMIREGFFDGRGFTHRKDTVEEFEEINLELEE